jgi:hypothetical protein
MPLLTPRGGGIAKSTNGFLSLYRITDRSGAARNHIEGTRFDAMLANILRTTLLNSWNWKYVGVGCEGGGNQAGTAWANWSGGRRLYSAGRPDHDSRRIHRIVKGAASDCLLEQGGFDGMDRSPVR